MICDATSRGGKWALSRNANAPCSLALTTLVNRLRNATNLHKKCVTFMHRGPPRVIIPYITVLYSCPAENLPSVHKNVPAHKALTFLRYESVKLTVRYGKL